MLPLMRTPEGESWILPGTASCSITSKEAEVAVTLFPVAPC